EVLAPSFDGTAYTYRVRVRSATASGTATVTASVRDAAGNVSEQIVQAEIDAERPDLSITVSPDPPRGGGSVLISVTSSEPLDQFPEVVASLDGQTPLPLDLPTQTGNTYEFLCLADELAVVAASAVDPAGNTGQAVLTFADLSVSSEELTLSAIPNLGLDVTVEAPIHNSGQARVENIPVRFMAGDLLEQNQLGADQYVSLDPGQSVVVGALWPAAEQTADAAVFVVIDPDETLLETDESNNLALRGPVVAVQQLDAQTHLITDMS
ncbi:unnamed protein product, partial [marine sediment metagenome]